MPWSQVIQLVASAPGAWCLVDDDGRCRAASAGMCRHLGVPADKLVGNSWLDHVHTADRGSFERVRTEGAAGRFEARLIDASGRERPMMWSAVPAGGGLLCMASDQLDRRLPTLPPPLDDDGRDARDWSAPARSRLASLQRLAALGSLAGSVSHQINDALTAVRLSLGRLISFELSRRPATAASNHRVEMLQEAREGVTRIERVARELRRFARAEAAPITLVDINQVVEAVVALTEHEVRHRASLVVELGQLAPVPAREPAVRRLVLDLVLNAVHGIDAGAAHLNRVRISTRSDRAGDVQIEVVDTGPGLAPDRVARILDPAVDLDQLLAVDEAMLDPTGEPPWVTLTRCRLAAVDLGGCMTVESEPGLGTRVRLVVPSIESLAAAEAGAAPAGELPEPAPEAPTYRILLVDDDRPVVAAIALELSDHDVVVAGSGREAIEILRRDTRFDAVLCDLMMPELSGMDVYEWVRPVEPELASRFVFMTGGAFTLRAASFVSSVPNPCLDKPFPVEDVRRMLAEVASTARRRAPTGGGDRD